jgi:hypothetical protein
MSFFFFAKIENRRAEQVILGVGVGTNGRGRIQGKGMGR